MRLGGPLPHDRAFPPGVSLEEWTTIENNRTARTGDGIRRLLRLPSRAWT